ncbi:putative sensor histidine kinase pdtaS [Methylophilaceae bacterium]|nr:putative sensor histidine kinase pdtaS [Methylophilaceae bacterium]
MMDKAQLLSYTLHSGLAKVDVEVGGNQFHLNAGELDSLIAHLGLLRSRMLPSVEASLESIHPDDRQRVDISYKKSIRNGVPYESTHRLLMKDGRSEWVVEHSKIEFDESGHAVGSTGSMQSLTGDMLLNVSLHQERDSLRELFERLPIPYQSVDEDGYLIDANAAWMQLFNRSQDEVIGRPIGDFLKGVPLSAIGGQASTLMQDERNEFSRIELTEDDGRLRYFDVIGCAAREGSDHSLRSHSVFIEDGALDHQEQQRIAEEAQHRNALVREVHHRIKNNLQGVTGILRNFLAHHPELNDPITNVISQVNSIAVIHGLQGMAAVTKVRLCELTTAIASNIESLWQTPIRVDIPMNWIPCRIAESEAVPLALVLNELISNAVKHGNLAAGVGITLRHEPLPHEIQVTIINSGLLPAGFEYPHKPATGSGMQLISSLLPRKGASLIWDQQDGKVIVRLVLSPPVITLEKEESESI